MRGERGGARGWLPPRPEGRCIPGGSSCVPSTPGIVFSHCVRIKATPQGGKSIFTGWVWNAPLTVPRTQEAAAGHLFQRARNRPFPNVAAGLLYCGCPPIWADDSRWRNDVPAAHLSLLTSHFSPLTFEGYDVFKKFSRSCLPTEVMIDSG